MPRMKSHAARPQGRGGSFVLDELGVRCEQNVPIGPRTWYGVGGLAAILAHPAGVEHLAALARRCHESDVPLRVLGAGANLLVSDAGIGGVVVQLDEPFWRQVRTDGHTLVVGAGHDLMKLVLDTARRGLGGLESLAGIPATVGGAIRMNAGGAFGQIGPAVQHVVLMDETGRVLKRRGADLGFAYRRTHIRETIIIEAHFDLNKGDPDHLMRRVKEVFAYKKKSQPLAEHSAGCAFKNPPAVDGGERLSAGSLIDQAGLKGHRAGGAQVSTKHANFVITHEGCTASDVLALMDQVQRKVEEQLGVRLEREVVVWEG